MSSALHVIAAVIAFGASGAQTEERPGENSAPDVADAQSAVYADAACPHRVTGHGCVRSMSGAAEPPKAGLPAPATAAPLGGPRSVSARDQPLRSPRSVSARDQPLGVSGAVRATVALLGGPRLGTGIAAPLGGPRLGTGIAAPLGGPRLGSATTATLGGPQSDRADTVIGRAQAAADPWTSEDKFRHVAASWAVAVFAYAAARSVDVDAETALVIAMPVTGAFGVAKEIADYRAGGPFSFRDLAADALGAGVAWLFLREVR